MDAAPRSRKHIGVVFDCCRVYARVYLSNDGRRYAGHCPRCLRALSVRAGAEGTTRRLFRAI